jgi:flagellar biosynthetic protein FlhB
MTKQEVKDEHKQSEGDPMVKGRIRALRMKRVRERMMKSVPQASVVVTNPTHYAVALKYDMDTMAAPKLVAKGVDFLAARIREMAEDNDVPIVENPPLARALYASVEIDQDIPPDQYKAVAEVIGFVMRQRQSGGWRPTPKAERERQSAEQTRQRDDGRMF